MATNILCARLLSALLPDTKSHRIVVVTGPAGPNNSVDSV